MTLREKAICELYTGIAFTQGDERDAVYGYASKLLGRPIYTHEFPEKADLLKQLSRSDFIRVCKGDFSDGGDANDPNQSDTGEMH